MGTFYKRLEQIAEHYKLSTVEVLRRCKIPYSTFRSLRLRKSDPQLSTVINVLKTCPKVRAEWLILGKGEMLIEEQKVPVETESEEVAQLKAQIEKLKSLLLEKEQRIINLEMNRSE